MNSVNNPYQQRFQERRKSSSRRLSMHWRQRWRYWISKRIPASRSIVLTHKNLFIFPSRAGLGFIFLLLLLLLVAINFENSAVYAMVFLLAGVFVVSILHTFFNLAGLRIDGLDGEPTFSGREAVFHFRFSSGDRARYGVQLGWQHLSSERVDIAISDDSRLALRYRTGPRGYCKPGRVKVESCYPLGLIRCWTWIDFDQQSIVFPSPDKNAGAPEFTGIPYKDTAENRSNRTSLGGSEDFYGLRDYVAGDSIRNIAWKNFAKFDQLSTRQFTDHEDQRLWLDWDQAGGNTEKRLQKLCHWALQAEAGHVEYGLSLPGQKLVPARGAAHLNALLTKLALYNLHEKKSGHVVRKGKVEEQSNNDTIVTAPVGGVS